jgi:VIT1/CCC1 family predicted Fe2+/Mn2+ transporter
LSQSPANEPHSSDAPDSWYHEKESAWLYARVADCEPDPTRAKLFRELGAAAEDQALTWQRLRAGGGAGAERSFSPSLRARIVAKLVAQIGPYRARPVLAAMKLRGLSVYSAGARLAHPMPTSLAEVGERHQSVSGGNLRAAVFGVNDGLVSNAALVMGVAGAGAEPRYVLITGIAGLLAGAMSMAAGEYVSVRSQREMYEYQIALEKEELDEYPDEEAEELALIYAARGLELEHARRMARELLADPKQALDVLAREELGLNPDDLGSPWGAAGASFVAFSLGAVLPLIPFLAGQRGEDSLGWTVAITTLALFIVGATISLFTGRSAIRSALRMVLIGGGAGALSWAIGTLIGGLLS